jgi:hypothetical protein
MICTILVCLLAGTEGADLMISPAAFCSAAMFGMHVHQRTLPAE